MVDVIKGVLVDTVNGKITVENVKNDLDEYYRMLNCRLIDIAVRKINGKYYDIICDDEGLLTDRPIPSAFDEDCNTMLCGNIFICSNDGMGNTIGITDDDVKSIMTKAFHVILKDGKHTPAIMMEY